MPWVPVKCPHCGASGQLMMPPQSAMVVGPCPVCSDYVVVFCGAALPLDKQVFANGTAEQKRTHLLDTIVEFLRARVTEAIPDDSELDGPAGAAYADAAGDAHNLAISQAELENFVKHELNLIDNKDYFRAIFD